MAARCDVQREGKIRFRLFAVNLGEGKGRVCVWGGGLCVTFPKIPLEKKKKKRGRIQRDSGTRDVTATTLWRNMGKEEVLLRPFVDVWVGRGWVVRITKYKGERRSCALQG